MVRGFTSNANVNRKENDRNGCFDDKLFCLEQDPFQSVPGPHPKLDTDILNVMLIKQENSSKGFSFC